ncbi:hypothetical protein [Microbacterium telephonicum]|uniref:hypothetical protein n=1 Tax=Microbacterium telephonicum TaxID=1714841 RepID=UPI0011C3FF09|nr:hypothetical protein [Microbacterium telephonicum]
METIANGSDRVVFMTGPVGPRPGVGVVSTVADPLVTVTTDFGDFQMPFAGDTPPTSGDTVGISWSSGPWCSKLSTSPDEPAQPPGPIGGGGRVQVAEFRAVDAGTTHSNGDWWQAQVWAADNNDGAWFFGSQVRDTIPAGATFESLQVFINRIQKQGAAPNWALHSSASKSGVPSFTGLGAWHPGGNGWQTPPFAAVMFDALKGGGSALGFGFPNGGYNKFASLAQDGMSGALKISWKG